MSITPSITVFRLSASQRWFFLGLLVVMAIAVGWMLALAGSMVWGQSSWLITPSLVGAGGPSRINGMGLLLLLMVVTLVTTFVGWLLTLGYACLFMWRYRLVFTETHLEVKTLWHPFTPRFRCAYIDVVQVKRGGFRGTLAIVPRTGQPLVLSPKAFDRKSERLLGELTKRLSPIQVEPNLAASLWAYTPGDRRFESMNWAFVILYLLVIALQLYAMVGHDWLVRGQTAWKPVFNPGLFNTIEAFTLDQAGTPWLIVGRSGSAGIFQLVHPATNEKWDMPAIPSDHGSNLSPDELVIDAQGHAWVTFGFDTVLHFDGTHWGDYPLPAGTDSLVYLVADDEGVWAEASSTGARQTHLLYIDSTSGQSHPMPLPASAQQANLRIQRIHLTRAGAFWVLTSDEKTQGQVYALQNGEWQKQGGAFGLAFPDEAVSFTEDALGQVWVLVCHTTAASDTYIVGRYDPTQAIWEWSMVADCCGPAWMSPSLVVDGHGRVWIQGETHRADGQPSINYTTIVEPIWGGVAREITHYTADNSNYQYDFFSKHWRFGPEGYLWVADDNLARIDTTLVDLPRPLPDWMQTIFGQKARLVWQGLVLIFVFANLIRVYWVAIRVRLKPTATVTTAPSSDRPQGASQ